MPASPMRFNPQDWYWQVATNSSMVYSSARNIYVDPASDTDYQNWQTANNGLQPPPIPNEADVWFYVQSFMAAWLWNGTTMSQPAVGQYTEDQLKAYATNSRYNTENSAMVAAGVPLITDDRCKQLLADTRQMAQADSTFTTVWVSNSDGNHYSVDAAQIIQMSNAVITRTEACFTTYSQVIADIINLTITTLAQIDEAFNAIAPSGVSSGPSPKIVLNPHKSARRGAPAKAESI